ncbi:MAG: YiiD C-terminal domain-containing protein [Rubrivivax sp.]|nr:YiiD C-terminal domain-containing protein [Rubrivivax sp.]
MIMPQRSFMQSRFFRLINFYPPLLGAGIRVVHRESDEYTIKVKMPLTRLNLNAVGTHFGGSLYAMCDPFFMLILMHHLGRDYIVWDKAAAIQFVKPGRGTVHARFHIPPDTIAAIKAQADAGDKLEPIFQVDVVDDRGDVIAKVEKRLYVRKRNK